jgi:FkbM family methyltransferase
MLALGSSRTRQIEWHTLVPSLLTPDSNVLDLGANVGRFSREIVHRFDCTCHAIEPNPELLALVPIHPRIKTYEYAISSRQTRLPLYAGPNSLAASLVKSKVHDGDDSSIMVESIDLPSFINKHIVGPISLIKMDIEGSEIEVLESLTDEFLVSIPSLSIEFHDFCNLTPADVVERAARRLERLGFYYLRMSGIGHQDTLFVNRRRTTFGDSDYLVTRYLDRYTRALKRIVRRRIGLPIG